MSSSTNRPGTGEEPATGRRDTPPRQSGRSGQRPGDLLPYHPPSLVRYGRLSELTRFGGSEILDSGGGLESQT